MAEADQNQNPKLSVEPQAHQTCPSVVTSTHIFTVQEEMWCKFIMFPKIPVVLWTKWQKGKSQRAIAVTVPIIETSKILSHIKLLSIVDPPNQWDSAKLTLTVSPIDSLGLLYLEERLKFLFNPSFTYSIKCFNKYWRLCYGGGSHPRTLQNIGNWLHCCCLNGGGITWIILIVSL